ncbi:MAG: C10 family peptidase [Ferruginibacter sp.]
MPITWGQDCSYNNLCPNSNCSDCSPEAVTGCVATAMAQVIRYWHPTNSFNYNYTSMPATSEMEKCKD